MLKIQMLFCLVLMCPIDPVFRWYKQTKVLQGGYNPDINDGISPFPSSFVGSSDIDNVVENPFYGEENKPKFIMVAISQCHALSEVDRRNFWSWEPAKGKKEGNAQGQ